MAAVTGITVITDTAGATVAVMGMAADTAVTVMAAEATAAVTDTAVANQALGRAPLTAGSRSGPRHKKRGAAPATREYPAHFSQHEKVGDERSRMVN